MSDVQRLTATRNHFELFALPVRYTLDRQALESAYLELTRLTHPDLAGADEESQLSALQLSARVNEGYATLRDDLRRAGYLLELSGVDPSECRLDPETMERVFELREAMSGAQAAGDEQGVMAAKAETRRWLEELQVLIAERLDAGFADLQAARLIHAARYLSRIIEA